MKQPNWFILLMIAYRSKQYYMEEWHTCHKPYSRLVEVGLGILWGSVGALITIAVIDIIHVLFKA